LKSRLIVALGLLLLLLMPLAPAVAQQEQGVRLELEGGFGGFAHNQFPVPVVVTLSNEGADLQGMVVIDFDRANADPVVEAVDLPRGARKRLTLWAQNIDFGQNTLRARFMVGDRNIARNSLPLTIVDQSIMLIARVTDGQAALLPNNFQPLMGKTGNVATFAPSALPDLDGLLRGLDVIVIGRGELAPAQVEALQRWVVAGGLLLIDGGPNGQPTSALDALLPATLGALGGGADVGQPDIQRARALQVRPGAHGMPTAEQPLWAERRIGAGVVRVSAVDLQDLTAERKQQAFWSHPLRIDEFQQMQLDLPADLRSIQMRIPGLTLPKTENMVAFLALYILLIGPANYLLLRKLDRREWAWLSIPGGVLLFTLVAYALGFGLRGHEAVLMDVTIVHAAPGQTSGRTWSSVGFSAVRRGTYALRIDAPGVVEWPSNQWFFGDTARGTINVDPTGVLVSQIRGDIGDVRQVQMTSSAPIPFQIEGVQRADNSIVVTNKGDQRLEKALIVREGRYHRLSLDPGASVTVTDDQLICCYPFNDFPDEEQEFSEAVLSTGQQFFFENPGFMAVPPDQGGVIIAPPLPPLPFEAPNTRAQLLVVTDQTVLPISLDRASRRLSATIYTFHLPKENEQ
jgi:hypothetical protein